MTSGSGDIYKRHHSWMASPIGGEEPASECVEGCPCKSLPKIAIVLLGAILKKKATPACDDFTPNLHTNPNMQ